MTAKKQAKLKPGVKPGRVKARELTLDDRLGALMQKDDEINALQSRLSALKHEFETLASALLEAMQTQGVANVGNTRLKVAIDKREVIGIDPTGWADFCAFIRKHDAFDLLHRRVTMQAVKDREAEGEKIPGIKRTTLVGLSLTRVKK